MKELSLEQKAKRYDEAIERAKSKIKNDKDHVLYEDDVIEIFPELKENRVEKPNGGIVLEDLNEGDGFYKVNLAYLSKEQVEEIESLVKKWNPESEDERIRKELIKLLRNLFNNYSYFIKDPFYTECIAWLEKQREQKPRGESAPEVIKELKYKDGDWIVYDNNVYKIVNIPHDNYYECLGIDNTIRVYNSSIDDKSHLWTIKDAKAGDVLYYNDDIIVIFKYFHDDSSFCSYCYIDGGVFFTSNGRTPVWWMNNVFYPATKEQRELLFTKMKESGHEWDADKKELVEQMTDEEHKQYILEHQDETIYDMSFEEAQNYLSKRGFDIPWNDGDVMVDERKLTQTVANVLKWADRHPLILPDKKK